MTKLTKRERQAKASPKVNVNFMTMPGRPDRTHQMQPRDVRTYCGKTPGQTLKKDAVMSDEPTCRQCQLGKLKERARQEEHTGQHEDCVECFQHDRALQAKQSAAHDKWKRRVDSLIRQWRQMRLRSAHKYRVEFGKAAQKYERALGKDYTRNSIQDGRGRMEAAIATEGVNTRIVTPEEPLSESAKALAAAVDGAEVPQICEQEGGVETYDND
jgi:hypothetical protein